MNKNNNEILINLITEKLHIDNKIATEEMIVKLAEYIEDRDNYKGVE